MDMSTKLLHIQPKELQFIFELRKQSTCTVQLANNTHHHVAFKVKTTSPKKYCVRPNVGIIFPKSTYEFSVIMQAQRTAPVDMLSKDKFLIQSTIVPSGTTEEDITASMFSKDGGKYIEEDKLKVVLISPLNSPIDGALDEIMDKVTKPNKQSGLLRDGLATNETPQLKDQNCASDEVLPSAFSTLRDQNGPSNGGTGTGTTHGGSRFKDDVVALKVGRTVEALRPSDENGALREEVLLHETSRLKDQNGTSKEELPRETLKRRDQNGALKEELSVEGPKRKVHNEVREGRAFETSHLEDPFPDDFILVHPPPFVAKIPKGVDAYLELNNSPSRFQKTDEVKKAAELEPITVTKEQLMLVKDVDEMKSKLNEIELKLVKTQGTISMMSEERRLIAQEVKNLKEKLMEYSRRGPRGRASNQVGFPPLFVCMVALNCIVLGYVLNY